MSTFVVESVPRADWISCSETELVVRLTDGRTLSVPLAWFPRLAAASVTNARAIRTRLATVKGFVGRASMKTSPSPRCCWAVLLPNTCVIGTEIGVEAVMEPEAGPGSANVHWHGTCMHAEVEAALLTPSPP